MSETDDIRLFYDFVIDHRQYVQPKIYTWYLKHQNRQITPV